MSQHFPDFDFSQMNEADVREEVIAPLLRALGYKSGTENNIARENVLRYARAYIGRKKHKIDPPLSGKADYVLEVRGFARWVLEAKPPDREISIDDVEQAHTYASHPEVSAFLFALCNGRRFHIYETWRPPNSGPVLDIRYVDFDREFGRLQSLLAPEAIRLSYPNIAVDVGAALAPGVRSRVRIRHGAARFSELRVTSSLPSTTSPALASAIRQAIDADPGLQDALETLKTLNYPVIGEECYRLGNGQIEARVQLGSPFKAHTEPLRQLGLDRMLFRTGDGQLSLDPQKPTTFEGTYIGKVPKGTTLLNLSSWKTEPLASDAEFASYAEVVGAVISTTFRGAIFQRADVPVTIPIINLPMLVTMENRGSIEVEIEPT